MGVDTIKALYVYTIAAVVVIGGGAALIFVPGLDQNTELVLAGFIGAAITFVFGQEAATRATRASQLSSEQGADQALTQPIPR